jgi:hypothetical protein
MCNAERIEHVNDAIGESVSAIRLSPSRLIGQAMSREIDRYGALASLSQQRQQIPKRVYRASPSVYADDDISGMGIPTFH